MSNKVKTTAVRDSQPAWRSGAIPAYSMIAHALFLLLYNMSAWLSTQAGLIVISLSN